MSDAVRLPQTPVEAIAELYRRVRDLEMARLRPIPLILAAWPIGSIFIHTTATNPADLLGGGVWTRFGEGRVLVSQDGSDSDFNASEKTGGAKTHAHSLPNHVHTIAHTHTNSNTGNPTTLPASNEAVVGNELPSTGSSGLLSRSDTGSATNAHRHTHALTNHVHSMSSTGASSAANSGNPTTNPNTGNGSSLPPYIVVYMWRRTA